MKEYQLLQKGQTNFTVTTNSKLVKEDTVELYKIIDTKDDVNMIDITPEKPIIRSIADGMLKQFTVPVPEEDCYLLLKFNGKVEFFRVGTPILKVMMYKPSDKQISYKLLSFTGKVIETGYMKELSKNIRYVIPKIVGDYIFIPEDSYPVPLHASYDINSSGDKGKVVFRKDTVVTFAMPVEGYTVTDLLKMIEEKYKIEATKVFEVLSTKYMGADSDRLDYVPGVTPLFSKHNFRLVNDYKDGKIISGIICKTKNYLIDNDPSKLIEIEWDTAK